MQKLYEVGRIGTVIIMTALKSKVQKKEKKKLNSRGSKYHKVAKLIVSELR